MPCGVFTGIWQAYVSAGRDPAAATWTHSALSVSTLAALISGINEGKSVQRLCGRHLELIKSAWCFCVRVHLWRHVWRVWLSKATKAFDLVGNFLKQNVCNDINVSNSVTPLELEIHPPNSLYLGLRENVEFSRLHSSIEIFQGVLCQKTTVLSVTQHDIILVWEEITELTFL